jgi:hypothetical protein
VVGRSLVDVLRAYLEQAGVVTPAATGRIVCTSLAAALCPQPNGVVVVSGSELSVAAQSTIRPPATGGGGLR